MSFELNNISLQGIINNLPGPIWVKDLEMRYIACNERCKNFVGLSSRDDLIGKFDHDLSWNPYAELYREGDKEILKGKSLSFMHPIQLYNGRKLIIITQKSPIKNNNEEIIGITGSIAIASSLPFVKSINHLTQFDAQLTGNDYFQYIVSDDFCQFNLTKREIHCLFHLVRGKTANDIANILFISKRTAEKHVDNIKTKLKCNTKSEIIAKAIENGFVHLVPSDFLISHINN
ncbi:hypothetical protein AYO45_01840 [Gammaproteobacteria bacterium SCGC AG-212-F23]|nr:hypothetical protein AYO45_01840 [Gammaproteobacteria bacterium SCGC AG-212-F23]